MKVGIVQLQCFKQMLREFADSKDLYIKFKSHHDQPDVTETTEITVYRLDNSRVTHYWIKWSEVVNVYKIFQDIVDDITYVLSHGMCVDAARESFNKACDSYDDAIRKYINNDIEQTRNLYKLALNSFYGYSANNAHKVPKIKDVRFNGPATIVFWSDGTKTVVKCENEEFDPEKGLAMAISKKVLGNKRDYYHVFLKWLKKYEEEYDKESVACEQLQTSVDLDHTSLQGLIRDLNKTSRRAVADIIESVTNDAKKIRGRL